jgi:hypothetical protein
MNRPTGPPGPTRRVVLSWTAVGAFLLAIARAATAPGEGDAYLAFIRDRAAALRAGDAPPRSLADWTEDCAEMRRRLALRPVLDPPPPLDPASHGTLDRDGYGAQKVSSRPPSLSG